MHAPLFLSKYMYECRYTCVWLLKRGYVGVFDTQSVWWCV